MEPTRFYSRRQEKKIAKQVGAKGIVPNSGATPFDKGDVDNGIILFEAKTSVKPQKSVSLQKDWLEKIREEAFAMGREMGVVAFDFGDGGRLYYVLAEDDFNKLRRAAEQ